MGDSWFAGHIPLRQPTTSEIFVPFVFFEPFVVKLSSFEEAAAVPPPRHAYCSGENADGISSLFSCMTSL